jgi:hypothetical protein
MAERQFVILRYVSKVSAMASCAKCQRTFFTLHRSQVTRLVRMST